MTIEQVKEEARKRLDREITDEQARVWLGAHPAGELSDEELDNVAGGGCGGTGQKDRDEVDAVTSATTPLSAPRRKYR